MSARPHQMTAHRPPTVEDASATEDSDASDVGEPVPPPIKAEAKRSARKNKYATSDSGYSSLTTTTASSSDAKIPGQAAVAPAAPVAPPPPPAPATQSAAKKGMKHMFDVINPKKQQQPKESATDRRRIPRKGEVPDLYAKRVESQRESLRIDVSGKPAQGKAATRKAAPVPVTVETHRSPTGGPGAFTPSPIGPGQQVALSSVPIPHPRPRTYSTAYYTYAGRPGSFHGAGSLPGVGMYPPPAPAPQQPILNHAAQIERTPFTMPHQPNYAPPAPYPIHNDPYAGQPSYMPNPMSSSPVTGGVSLYGGYPPSQPPAYYQPPPPPPQWQSQDSFYPNMSQQPPPQQALPGPPQRPMSMAGRRTSMNGPPYYDEYNPQNNFYPPPSQALHQHPQPQMREDYRQPPQLHYHAPPAPPVNRRYSATTGPVESIYSRPAYPARALAQKPYEEEAVFEQEADEGYYDDYRVQRRQDRDNRDRQQMPPPPFVPAPRPQTSAPQRPIMPPARTTSTVHTVNRRSGEYTQEYSPRKASFESRPPSRPGFIQHYSSASLGSRSSREPVPQIEPASPSSMRRRPTSQYEQQDADRDSKYRDAEAYQLAQTGGYQPNVSQGDLPAPRRAAKSSETGSRGSSSREGSDKRHKRTSRHSLSGRHEQSEGITLNFPEGFNPQGTSITMNKDGGIQLSWGGGNFNDNGGLPAITAGGGGSSSNNTSRPPSRSMRPARESSQVRPSGKRYISEGSTGGHRSRDSGVYYEEPRRPERRSSSTVPAVGALEEAEILAKFQKMNLVRSRDSRSSSRSAKAGRREA